MVGTAWLAQCLVLVGIVLESQTAFAVSIEIPLANATGSQAQFNTSPDNALNDGFNYDPNLPYFSPTSIPAGSLPDTNFGVTTSWLTGTDSSSRFWEADVTLGGSTLDWIDVWGRANAAPGQDGRHQSLTLSFFSGTGGGGSLLGASSLFDPSEQVPGVPGSAYGRFDVASVLNSSQRSQVGSFRIDQPAMLVPDQFMLLQEVRAASGEPVSPVPVVFVDRDTGEVSIVNGGVARDLIGYSITSGAGALNPDQWDSFSSGANNGTLDPDSWISFSSSIAGGANLSEGELPGGSGGYSLAAAETLELGSIWSKVATEDVGALLLNGDGSSSSPAVVYTGNNGTPYIEGDLDFDDTISIADWALFRTGFGGVFPDLTGGQTYVRGDLDGDLDVDIDDFLAFESAYDTANPGASFALAIRGVPEPGALALGVLGLALVGLIRVRNKATRRFSSKTLLAAIFCLTGTSLPVDAQVFSIIPAPADLENDVSESAFFGPGFEAASLFDTTVIEADINVRLLGATGAEFASNSQEPVSIFVDNNTSISTNWIAYAQRSATVDHVGKIEVWFADTDFGDALPSTAPDAVADIADRSNPDRFNSFQLSSTVSGRYAAMRFTRAPDGFIFIGGREFRFLEGPDQFVLEVNTVTGDLAIKNTGALAQGLDIDAYEIASQGGSLSSPGFSGLSGLAGFPTASSDNLGDGWELGLGSGSNLLTEAYLLGDSSVAIDADLSLGAGYNASVDARDLTFSYSLENGTKIFGAVEYFVPLGITGDYNSDGTVDAADYTLYRDNLGSDSSLLANNLIPGNVGPAHYSQWSDRFGETIGSTVSVSVPEPTTASLALFAVALFSLGSHAKLRSPWGDSTVTEDTKLPAKNKGDQKVTSLAYIMVTLLTLAVSADASTPDRIYLLGDDSNEVPASEVNELGSANLGQIIGSQTGTTFDGVSLDHAGNSTNLNTFADLTPTGDPRYVDVGSSGLGRPGLAGVGVGADFDGGDYLSTLQGFGNPSNADDSYQNTIDYSGLINHYMQGWARPASAGLTGQRQTIIQDTDQFSIHINTDASGVAHWGHFYALHDQFLNKPVAINEWSHVAQFTNGDLGVFWVNGIVAGVLDGYYQPNGNGPEGNNTGSQSLSLGAELTGNGSTPSNYYTGQLDDFDVRVTGDNSNLVAGADYGAFDFESDNAYVENLVATGQLVAGDVNGDLLVNGDGTGNAISDDVSFFIDHYLNQQIINFEVIGDLKSRTQMADLNYTGTTDLFDWFILIQNHENTGLASSLDFDAILSARNVPEPSCVAMLVMLLATPGVLGMRSHH